MGPPTLVRLGPAVQDCREILTCLEYARLDSRDCSIIAPPICHLEPPNDVSGWIGKGAAGEIRVQR